MTPTSVAVPSMIESTDVRLDKCLKRLEHLTAKRDRFQSELNLLDNLKQRETWMRSEWDRFNRRIAEEQAEKSQLEERLADTKPPEPVNAPADIPTIKPAKRRPRPGGKKDRKAQQASRAA